MDSLNTSRPRSSRPRTGVDQLIKSTRSDIPTLLLLAARRVTGPMGPNVSDRVMRRFLGVSRDHGPVCVMRETAPLGQKRACETARSRCLDWNAMKVGLLGDTLHSVHREASSRRPVIMLHAGLDLSRNRLDVCLL